jgi:hypothetical protein
MAQPEGLRLALARMRHGLGNACTLLDARLLQRTEVLPEAYQSTLADVQQLIRSITQEDHR